MHYRMHSIGAYDHQMASLPSKTRVVKDYVAFDQRHLTLHFLRSPELNPDDPVFGHIKHLRMSQEDLATQGRGAARGGGRRTRRTMEQDAAWSAHSSWPQCRLCTDRR